jgi:hypothetical protein
VRTELRGVKAPLSDVLNGDTSNIVATTATVNGLLPFGVVEANAPRGMKISAAGDDLRIQGRLSYAGLSAPVQATVSVKASGSGIALTPRDVRSGGGRIPVPAALVRERLGFTIPLRSLPMGARITGIEVAPQGLRMTATAENVKLAR